MISVAHGWPMFQRKIGNRIERRSVYGHAPRLISAIPPRPGDSAFLTERVDESNHCLYVFRRKFAQRLPNFLFGCSFHGVTPERSCPALGGRRLGMRNFFFLQQSVSLQNPQPNLSRRACSRHAQRQAPAANYRFSAKYFWVHSDLLQWALYIHRRASGPNHTPVSKP